ncbi:MAG: site-specific integrase [Ignavibacteriae bacterium]|nr:site-specific integrase [Ignavibacteriota bacterium]
MFLSKHKNGIYYVYFTNPFTDKRSSISTKKKLKKEALKFLTTFEKSVERKKELQTIPITLKQFHWNFLKYSESIHSKNTTNTFKTTFNSALKYFGDVQLSTLSHSKIQEFLSFKIRTVSKYQARKDLINLSSAFNKAVSDNHLNSNPCSGIKRIKIPEKQPRFFSELDLSKLLEIIENDDVKDLTIFAVNTGLRQMELLTLNWEQISFKDKLLTLDNRNHLTKSKKIRTIPLNIASMQILVGREQNKNNKNVFTYFGKTITQDQISKAFKKYVLKADINPQLNFHSLRHTFASWLVQRGVSIYQVSKLLGHADIKTTEIYSHLRAEDLRKAVDLIT